MKYRWIAKTVAVFFVFQLFSPMLVSAADFNPNFILSDRDLVSFDSMTVTEIQRFLDAQNSGIKSRKFIDEDGTEKTAAQIIWEAAQAEKINPRYLLVMLQKEQSLINDSVPSEKQLDWATGYGVCDNCSLSDPAIQRFKGFAIQVRRSAGLMRFYYDNMAAMGWIKRAGQTYTIDNTTVTPQSHATAFLYTYTPHFTGNKNFWRLWNTWFMRIFPDGTLLQPQDEKTVYLVQNGQKRPFTTKAALISRFDPKLVIQAQPQDLANFTLGAPISLPNYTLARTPNGTIYLLIDDTKNPIASQAVFKTIGFHPDEVEDVSDADLAGYQSGTFITTASVYPLGAVVQDKKTKSYYYIRNGQRQVIPHGDVVKVNYPKKKVVTLDSKALEKFPLTNQPVLFKDGTLLAVKGAPFVYVVSNGQRRYVPNESTFKFLGYQTANIFFTTEQGLASVPEGAALPDASFPTQLAQK